MTTDNYNFQLNNKDINFAKKDEDCCKEQEIEIKSFITYAMVYIVYSQFDYDNDKACPFIAMKFIRNGNIFRYLFVSKQTKLIPILYNSILDDGMSSWCENGQPRELTFRELNNFKIANNIIKKTTIQQIIITKTDRMNGMDKIKNLLEKCGKKSSNGDEKIICFNRNHMYFVIIPININKFVILDSHIQNINIFDLENCLLYILSDETCSMQNKKIGEYSTVLNNYYGGLEYIVCSNSTAQILRSFNNLSKIAR